MENERLFVRLFINRVDKWFRQEPSWVCESAGSGNHNRLRTQHITGHLRGDITLGLAAIDDNGLSKFCAWDEDNLDGRLELIAAHLTSLGIHYLRISSRPGRAGHLFVLFDGRVAASDLLLFNESVRLACGITTELEFFPKSAIGLSNIRAPLGVNRKPEAGWRSDMSKEKRDELRGWFIGPDRNLEAQLSWLAVQRLNMPDILVPLIASVKIEKARQDSLEKARQTYFRPPRFEGPSLLEMLEDLKVPMKKIGDQYVLQCPLCRDEGRDRSEDNLRINSRSGKFNCFQGGPGVVHGAKNVYGYFAGLIDDNRPTFVEQLRMRKAARMPGPP